MDTKARIGLAIAVIATTLSLVSVMAVIIVTPPDSADAFLKGCFVRVATDQTVVRDRTFTSPSNCAAHGDLLTNNFMISLCDAALTSWVDQAQTKCKAIVLPPVFVGETKPFTPCRMSGFSWVVASGVEGTKRSCEEDPGHFSKLTCTVKGHVGCAPPGQCEKDCETSFTSNAAKKTACMKACAA